MNPEAPTPTDAKRRLLILAALWLFALLVLVLFRSVVTPFAGAALVAYLIAPLVDRMGRLSVRGRSLPRWVAILAVYFVFFLLVYLFMVGLLPQLYRELARITREALGFVKSLTPQRVQELAVAAESWLLERGIPVELAHHSPAMDNGWSLSLDLAQGLEGLAERASGFLEENLGGIVAVSRSIVTSLLASVFMLFFILMVAAFFTLDSTAIRAYSATLVPSELAQDMRVLVQRIDRSLAGVVRGQVIICLVNGVLTFIGLVLLKVKFAVLLATVATLFSLIPIFGSILSSIPIVLIGLSQGWGTGLGALGWIVGIHALEAYFLNPKIMGSAARIHPVVVAFSLIAGERTFGLLGALFAVPVAAIVVACFDFARQKAQPSTSADVHPLQPAGQGDGEPAAQDGPQAQRHP